MKMKVWLSLVVVASLIVINCLSVTRSAENDEDYSSVIKSKQLRPPIALLMNDDKTNRRPKLNNYWHKNEKPIRISSKTKSTTSKYSFQDEKDLAELNQLKQLGSSNSLALVVQSSIEELIAPDNKDSIILVNPRQVLGTTTTTETVTSTTTQTNTGTVTTQTTTTQTYTSTVTTPTTLTVASTTTTTLTITSTVTTPTTITTISTLTLTSSTTVTSPTTLTLTSSTTQSTTSTLTLTSSTTLTNTLTTTVASSTTVTDTSTQTITTPTTLTDTSTSYLTSSITLTDTSTITSSLTLTDTSTTTVTNPTTLTDTLTTIVVSSTTLIDTETLITPTTIYQTSTIQSTETLAVYRGVGAAGAAIAAAAAVGVAVGLGIGAARTSNRIDQVEQVADLIVTIVEDAGTELFVDPVTGFVGLPDEFAAAAATPFNRLPIPVTGQNFSPLRQVQLNDDGPAGGVRFSQRTGSSSPDAAGSYYCDDESVLFDDGICYALLQQGPCPDRLQWLTLDPISLRGQCSRRLCGRGRVFVGRTGLCHDDDDPIGECRGGRKLFYTAYGDPICDCPPGHFPYPSPRDDCLALFTQGPCRDGLVLSLSSSTGEFICSLDGQQQTSRSERDEDDVIIGDAEVSRLLPADNGLYYPLGSTGPCRPSFLFDFDVFQLKTKCTSAPNLLPREEDEEKQHLDLPIYNRVNGDEPNRFHDQLLNPCRPGKRNGNNFKCANSFLISKKVGLRTGHQQAVKSVLDCDSSGGTLQATGQCSSPLGSDGARRSSCGPSYVYIESIGQCEQIFE